MEYYSRVHTSKCHIPLCYLRTPSPKQVGYSVSLLQNVEEFFGREEDTEQAATEDKTRRGSSEKADEKHEEGVRGDTRGSARGWMPLQDALAAEAQTWRYEALPGSAAAHTVTKPRSSLRTLVIRDSPGVSRFPTEQSTISPPTSVAACEETPRDSYSIFCEDEEALEAVLEETAAAKLHCRSETPWTTGSQIRAALMFSCASSQAATPPAPQEQQQTPTQLQEPRTQQQKQPQTAHEQQPKESGKPPVEVRRAPQETQGSEKATGGKGRSRRRDGGRGRRGRHRLQQPLRSYSMLDIENDAFTGVHENDVESEAGQCLRNMKTICGFCLLCFGLFLLLTCPRMKQTSPLTFYYILCTMLAELFIALCFGCSICMLACLVGEHGAVYANATCGLLHRVAEGIAHYTLTGFGGYLLYNFRALEGEWYASGEAEQDKFLYLLIYVGCEATMSLLYSLQTLGTLFGICRFIVIKVYSKLTGRGDVFFLHGDAPIIYASLDQYNHALRHMRNPVEVAFERRRQFQQRGPPHALHLGSNNSSKDMC